MVQKETNVDKVCLRKKVSIHGSYPLKKISFVKSPSSFEMFWLAGKYVSNASQSERSKMVYRNLTLEIFLIGLLPVEDSLVAQHLRYGEISFGKCLLLPR